MFTEEPDMSPPFGRTSFRLSVLAICSALQFTAASARAQVLYQLDSGNGGLGFNNSFSLLDTEDNWVANSFQVVEGGTHLVSLIFLPGWYYTDQPITALVYKGSDLNDPTAGSGLILLTQTDTTITGNSSGYVEITLDAPVDLDVGDVFYTALLMRKVPANQFPFVEDLSNPLGQSFFDVGPNGQDSDWDPNQGSGNITILGGSHPVIGGGIQRQGNLVLRVRATTRCP
jgi:hypothetical protein